MADWAETTFFTLKRRERAVLLPATIVYVFGIVLLIGLFVAINWNAFGDFFRLAQQASESPGEAESLQVVGRMFQLIGTLFLFLFPLYLLAAAYEAACLRWMLRGEAPGLFGITLDRDAWRVYGIFWCWFIGNTAISFVASAISIPLMMATMGGVTDPSAAVGSMLASRGPLMLLQYGAMIFLGVRLAPAAAASIAANQFVFFRAWRATKGKFWPLFGSFAVVWGIAMVGFAIVIGAAIFMVVGSALAYPFPSPGADGAEIMKWLMSPPVLAAAGLYIAATLIMSVAMILMTFGINAATAKAALEEGALTPATAAPMPPSSVVS